jgi:hypothetical protein
LLASLLIVADNAKFAPPATALCAVVGNRATMMGGKLTATVTEAFFVESATDATVTLTVHAWDSEAGGA